MFTKNYPFTSNVYEKLKTEILKLKDVYMEPKKKYIAFKHKTNACDVVLRKDRVIVFINLPIGSFCYSLYLFITNQGKSKKACLCFLLGMISFIVVYGSFAIICNITKIEILEYIIK